MDLETLIANGIAAQAQEYQYPITKIIVHNSITFLWQCERHSFSVQIHQSSELEHQPEEISYQILSSPKCPTPLPTGSSNLCTEIFMSTVTVPISPEKDESIMEVG